VSEGTEPHDHTISFAPGLDAAINCNLGLINVHTHENNHDNSGIHRGKDAGAGAFSYYGNQTSYVSHEIPRFGELFKHYGGTIINHALMTKNLFLNSLRLSFQTSGSLTGQTL
jgi:hypothetical protein